MARDVSTTTTERMLQMPLRGGGGERNQYTGNVEIGDVGGNMSKGKKNSKTFHEVAIASGNQNDGADPGSPGNGKVRMGTEIET